MVAEKIVDSCTRGGSISETVSETKLEKHQNPMTPLSNVECVEISSSSDQTEEKDPNLGFRTPTWNLFNPFSPAPEEQTCGAPKKKMLKRTRASTCRKLSFSSCTDLEDNMEEEELFELVYMSVVEVIVLNQVKEISSEDFQTPTASAPFLTGVADTVPAAPLRPTMRMKRNTSVDRVCRKLEF